MTVYPANVAATVLHLHELLANRRYAELELISGGRCLTAQEIAAAVREYGCNVVGPPDDLQLDVVKVETARDTWSVCAPIFTKEEGRSDLTLEVTLTETGGPLCNVEIDGLHVL